MSYGNVHYAEFKVEWGGNNPYWIGCESQNNFMNNQFSTELLQGIRGPFSLIFDTDKNVIIVADTIRSYPVFYSVVDGAIYISDNAETIAKRINTSLSNSAVKEFLKASFVTEKNTLFSGIFTLNPGTYVCIDKTKGIAHEEQWMEFEYRGISNDDGNDLINEFDCILNTVFKDVINRNRNRTILVPLSGGCDSRTVVAKLKKHGAEKVVCFSYGRIGNEDSYRSKIIAKNLGYEWHYVEYTGETWKQLRESKEYTDFLSFSCRGTGIGCIQALPAMIELKDRGVIPDNTVVIPGHTLDVVMGSHLSDEQLTMDSYQTIGRILLDHYLLRDSQKEFGDIEKWTEYITDNSIESYMKWEWHNRQSKFIANDVRAYEWVGCDFELPFWDKRVLDFCSEIPCTMLFGRRFQYEYTSQVINPMVGISQTFAVKESSSTLLSKSKKLLKQLGVVQRILDLKHQMGRRNDMLAAYDWLTDEEYSEYKRTIGKRFNLNSIEAEDYITYIMRYFDMEET